MHAAVLICVAYRQRVENRGAVSAGSDLEAPTPGRRWIGWILVGVWPARADRPVPASKDQIEQGEEHALVHITGHFFP
jgi:hypothetical protein